MKILKAYKTEINPNNSQITKMRMNCGAARFGFNFALERKKEAFDKKEKIPNNIELHRELNKIKGLLRGDFKVQLSRGFKRL
jgi:putative transposase